MTTPTALIADDEPLLREVLRRLLAQAWPELQVVAEARNGLEALQRFEQLRPSVCFLDVHMPGLSGIEVAQRIGRQAHLVFVTAYDQYALQAFEQGVLDYLVKPVQAARLQPTVERLRERLGQMPVATETLLQQLAAHFHKPAAEPLRWIKAQVGEGVRLIPVEDIDYLKSDEKYTLVAWRDGSRPAEALIRTPLKELASQLDPKHFQQVHRAVIVNLRAVREVVRGLHETADLFLHGRPEKLPVSRTYLPLFKAE
ncbi:MAG: response regulator transcription factor [Burkholderiales bacterium]|nr:response regulator transcription factor [Burkholderiales bacterium]